MSRPVPSERPKGILTDLDATLISDRRMAAEAITLAAHAVFETAPSPDALARGCVTLVFDQIRAPWRAFRERLAAEGFEETLLRRLAVGYWELLLCPLERDDFGALDPSLVPVAHALYDGLPALRQTVWESVLHTLGRPAVEAPLMAERAVAERWSDRVSVQFIPGAPECLQKARLANVPVCIVTNGGPWQHAKIRHAGLRAYVGENVVISAEVGVRKPDVRIIQIALARIGCAARDAVIIDDMLETGVLAGVNAGLRHSYWLNVPSAQRKVTTLGPEADGKYTEVSSWARVAEILHMPRLKGPS